MYRIFVRHEETKAGANSEWIPGGFTPKGNSEAVIDAVDWSNVIQTKISK